MSDGFGGLSASSVVPGVWRDSLLTRFMLLSKDPDLELEEVVAVAELADRMNC